MEKTVIEALQGTATVLEDKGNATTGLVYLESYGCQMNFSDSEIVAAILAENGFGTTRNFEEADLILLNTCAIREKAEQTVRHRLMHFNGLKRKKPHVIIGVLGCMAERIKNKLLEEEKIVDLVVGPDAYRDLPQLIKKVQGGQKSVNVLLSREETYANISPIRLDSNGVTAFISIMRGCDNMCSFCVVPFTRGRERSRDNASILHEARYLYEQGYREVTLLGQNVDSYKYQNEDSGNITRFAELLQQVAEVAPDLRVRFSTSHPKDMTDEVLQTMARYPNICKYIHLPVQSGSTEILQKMNRGYDSDWYKERILAIRKYMPDCAISTDIIAGFCTETQQQHEETLAMMDFVQYDFAYMFKYSERPNTYAQKRYQDDVPEEIKSQRLQEIIDKQQTHSLRSNEKEIGRIHEVLVEGVSKKSPEKLFGRTTSNKVVVFDKENLVKGQYVRLKITSCTGGTLRGEKI